MVSSVRDVASESRNPAVRPRSSSDASACRRDRCGHPRRAASAPVDAPEARHAGGAVRQPSPRGRGRAAGIAPDLRSDHPGARPQNRVAARRPAAEGLGRPSGRRPGPCRDGRAGGDTPPDARQTGRDRRALSALPVRRAWRRRRLGSREPCALSRGISWAHRGHRRPDREREPMPLRLLGSTEEVAGSRSVRPYRNRRPCVTMGSGTELAPSAIAPSSHPPRAAPGSALERRRRPSARYSGIGLPRSWR